ncbi:MAG: transcription-repair coupling factor [Rhodobacter sp.]|nr:transcription-repair coupling factor [Rhodobacter sp.]
MPRPDHITVGGAPEGFDAKLLIDELSRSGSAVIHVCRDDRRLEAMRSALRFFAPDVSVLAFPGWDCLPYDRISPNAGVSAARMATLAALAREIPETFVLLTTLNAASQKVPEPELLRESTFSAAVGHRVDERALRDFLPRMGFARAPTVTEPGDYAIRGGIVDIFPPGRNEPVRLDFFGDVLDQARRFDPASQRTTEKLSAVELAPVSEVILDDRAITLFRQNYRIEFGAASAADPLYEAVSERRKYAGLEHWLPFFHERLVSLFAYLPGATVCLDDQVTPARLARWDGILEQYATRTQTLESGKRFDTVYKPCPPDRLYLDDSCWTAALEERRVVQFSRLPLPTGPGVIDAGGRIGREFAPERSASSGDLFQAVADHISAGLAKGDVVLAANSEGAAERLGHLLEERELDTTAHVIQRHSDLNGQGVCATAVWPLESGFEIPGLTVIAEQDILGDRLIRAPKTKRRAENFLTEARSLTPGELVVHVEHGIGRFTGLGIVDVLGAAHECLVLEYAGGTRLYLPVENIELLSRYGREEGGSLDRLGAAAWQARKARLKSRIGDLAEKLLRIAAERHLRDAPVLEPPEGIWDAFNARFPYVETEDQLRAVDDVLRDLASGKPMDRLICGDVGFGKTEVALRAAFVAAMSGRQVAVIVPTTLLARQHFQTFSERFRGFPVRIRHLSRFVSTDEADSVRAGLRDGGVDVVIGTHALLSKSVRFRALGLLVIDEEQRFGVTHKERLKELGSDIHVLTLTATPIPRTLQLSLTGVRDLSLIGTPPVDRLSIRTYVSEFDAVTIREALLRERYRGGQSFYIVPRISDIRRIEEFLSDRIPEVSFVSAHSEMPSRRLDDTMNAFYDGKYDVLVSTTIVESGLDIPTANTVVVDRVDRFGLAQIYQIRGRVGRSKTRAYAYLTTRPGRGLTQDAERRLRVLSSLDSLGAGFSLASRDLDIRGAGNLLGGEQSGHIHEVGYELYQSMLEEAIARIRSGEAEGLPESDGQWSPEINLGVPVLIPESYVPDLGVRLGLYRRLSGLGSKVEVEGFAAELIDRFGKLPREVNMLLWIVRIKYMCRRAGIARMDAGPMGVTIRFHKDQFANPAGLAAFLQSRGGQATFRDTKVALRCDWKKTTDRIRGAFATARELAGLARDIRSVRGIRDDQRQGEGARGAEEDADGERQRGAVEPRADHDGDRYGDDGGE